MEFEKRKALTLAALNSTETDKSPKGFVDVPILPLLKTLNLHPSYFTTSSCSGRISILSHPIVSSTTHKKARGGTWLFISHDPVTDPSHLLSQLFTELTLDDSVPPVLAHPSELVFRFEPLIIAVECRDSESAQWLVSTAISSGFRESGITSLSKRVIVGIRCSIKMEVPLGDTNRIMVSREYVKYLVGIANAKMEMNRKRTDGFLKTLLSSGFQGPENMTSGDQNEDSEGLDHNDSEHAVIQMTRPAHNAGSVGVFHPGLPVISMAIEGEPVEKLFLWGHSACTFHNQKKVVIFGGFGGMGRHARKNDLLLLNPSCGTLITLDVKDAPSARLGHTSSVVGDYMYIIGGRADPTNILNDAWVFDLNTNKFKQLKFIGLTFPPRHRHAAAAVGSNIYIYGGLNSDTIFSSLHVLDTHNMQWNEICVSGDLPTARHSHSLVAYGSQLYMFGGHDGDKALGDLYSFDTKEALWKKVQTKGKAPHPRFSHSMFVYRNFLGVIGGCPISQCQDLALFDIKLRSWTHVVLQSVGKHLFVRTTVNVIHDDIVLIGGGASCFAFGTKFSETLTINLLPLMSLNNSEKKLNCIHENLSDVQYPQNGIAQIAAGTSDVVFQSQLDDSYWVLQLQRKYAKFGKDILKKFGWLDLGRKVYSPMDKKHICFPVTRNFCVALHDVEQSMPELTEDLNDHSNIQPIEYLSPSEASSKALNYLKGLGASLAVDEVCEIKRTPKSPLLTMKEAVEILMKREGLPIELLEQLPARWERLGDIVVLPITSFKDPAWVSLGSELWLTVAKSLGANRLARQGIVAPTATRDSTLEILVGDCGWVEHHENGILYSFDATKCMFSWGNLSEKLRMSNMNCCDEVIVDLFAGIGYFVLPFLVRAKAKLVYACEWNPHGVEALRRNLQSNLVTERCIVLEGDNRIVAPKGVAHRVCLGLIPSSEASWPTAVRALRTDGGLLHIHANVRDSEEGSWKEHVSKTISEIARDEGHNWEVILEHVERVKWYAPHIRHLVADVRCRQI